eukprot:2267981-Pleurochrysis_carterae.AAC.4
MPQAGRRSECLSEHERAARVQRQVSVLVDAQASSSMTTPARRPVAQHGFVCAVLLNELPRPDMMACIYLCVCVELCICASLIVYRACA